MTVKKTALFILFLIIIMAVVGPAESIARQWNVFRLEFDDAEGKTADVPAMNAPQADVSVSGTATVIFTFDDGYVSDYELAYPILKKYGIRGTSYIIPEYQDTNRPYTLKWDEIREMKQYGWDFGCHTYSHTDVTKMAADEIKKSMESVNAAFTAQGLPAPKIHAFPFGKYDEAAIEAMKPYRIQMRKAFYETKFVDPATADPYEIDCCSADMQKRPRLLEHEKLVDKAVNEKAVIVFRCHCLYRETVDDMGDWPVQTDSRLFAELVKYCFDKGCRFMTMSELAQTMQRQNDTGH